MMKKHSRFLGVVLGLSCFSFWMASAPAKPRATRKATPKKAPSRQSARRVVPLPPRETTRLDRQLKVLLARRQEMLQAYTPNSPEVQTLNRQIEAVKSQLRGEADGKARFYLLGE